MKRVKRTYYSKKRDEWITKEYKYTGKSRRGLTLVGKGGKITNNSKKNVDKFIKSIKENPEYTEAEKRTLVNDLYTQVMAYSSEGKKLTTTGFMGLQQEEKIPRMLTNLGYTSYEISELYDIPEEEVLNNDNWSGDVFTYGGLSYLVQFNYTGDVLIPMV